MFKFRSGYFYMLAVGFVLFRFIKQLYFATSFYNKSLKTKTPEQFYFYPNPYLLSSFISRKNFSFELTKINPENFWNSGKDQKKKKDLHSFFWLNLINRKNDNEIIQKIILIWISKNTRFNNRNWQNLNISKRVLAWMLNADIILSHANISFKKQFFNSIITQVNHLKKNINYENDPRKKIEIISVIILSGLVFKEYNSNFEIGLKLLKNVVEEFFNIDGSPKSRSIYDLVQCSKFLILVKECCKDAQEYIPDYLDDIVQKLVDCVFSLQTSTQKNPLFNGASEFETDSYLEYLKGLDYNSKEIKDKIADIYIARSKKTLLFFDAGSPPKKIFSNNYQSGPLSFEYFFQGKKIITNCGYGNKISPKIELISRLTSAQSTLTLNDTSVVKFENNNLTSKVFGTAIASSFEVYDFKAEEENNYITICAKHNGYKKKFNYIHERLLRINKGNQNLLGEDILTTNKNKYNDSDNIYNIRFHLYPGITAVQTMAKNSILIQIEKNKSLIFKTSGENLHLEKSIFLGRNQIVNNFCITISGTLTKNENKHIKWELLKNN